MLKRRYGFKQALNIFDETDNKCNKLSDYNSKTPNKIKYNARVFGDYRR